MLSSEFKMVGSYITVGAVTFAFLTKVSLMLYSGFVLALSSVLLLVNPHLTHSVFVPGLLTILIQANVGLWARLALAAQSLENQRKAEQERLKSLMLGENIKVRDEFISIASHELNTPLSSLRLQAQMMARDLMVEKFNDQQRNRMIDATTIFNRQVNRLIELVETMLDVSRISTGRLLLNVDELDLVAVARECIAGFEAHLAADPHSLKIQLEAPPRLVIRADSSRIKQVFENLLSNAIKYGNGKDVKVRLTLTDHDAEIAVEDSGIGLAPDSVLRIFDRYERGVPVRNVSGFGLGLYITRNIVQAHHGDIQVKSTLGQGSVFTVKIPLRGDLSGNRKTGSEAAVISHG